MTADYRRNQRAIGVAPCRSKRNSAEVGLRRDWSGTSGDPNPHLSIVLGTGGRKRDRGDVNSRLDVRDRRKAQVWIVHNTRSRATAEQIGPDESKLVARQIERAQHIDKLLGCSVDL